MLPLRDRVRILLPVLALLAAGCGGNVVLKGELQKNGQPYVFADGEEMQINLVGEDPSGKPLTSAAEIDKQDATFRFKGPTGEGIPPGKYKITLTSQLFSGPKAEGDRFAGAFSPERTPLSCAVTTARDQQITIDVMQKKVTAK
jgi:hypothetical protein